jgi:glycosyltransferase involved in cell wall biosynthesis
MKVLHVVKTAIGASWVYHQIGVLLSVGIKVVIALPDADQGFGPKYQALGATVISTNLDVPVRCPSKLASVVAACRRLVLQIKPDIIHTHHVGPTYLVRLALGKRSPIPRIFQVAGPLHLEHRLFSLLDVATAGSRDHWVATCRWTYEKYRDMGVDPNLLHLSYAGTDLTRFSGTSGGTLRKELGLGDDIPLIGMVAYMYAPKRFLGQRQGLKGHEDFMLAIRHARREYPKIRAVVIGGAWNGADWYEKRLRRLGARLCQDAIAFLGSRTDIPELYKDLDLAVVPSHSENVGGAVEPLLNGIPVVATSVGGLPDLVQNERSGIVVPPHEPHVLGDAILRAIKNPELMRALAMEGHKRAKTLFDVQTTGREVANIYGRILNTSAFAD